MSLKSAVSLMMLWCIGLIYLISWFILEVESNNWWHFPTALLLIVLLAISFLTLFNFDEFFEDIIKKED